MNKYTCLNCGLVSVLRLAVPDHTMLCSCTGKPQAHKLGVIEIKKAAKQNAVELKPVPSEKVKLPDPPVVFDASKQTVLTPVTK